MKRTLFENLDALMILACAAVCIAVWLTCSGCVAKGAVEAPMTVFNKESARVFADAIGERFDKTAEAIGEQLDTGMAWIRGIGASIFATVGGLFAHETRKHSRDRRISRNGGASGG